MPEDAYTLADRLAVLRGVPQPVPQDDEDRAVTIVNMVTAMARAYTRDAGFVGGAPNADIAAVIVTASARLLAHPDQLPVSQNMGAISVEFPRGGFQGWSLVERSVLDRYRAKAL